MDGEEGQDPDEIDHGPTIKRDTAGGSPGDTLLAGLCKHKQCSLLPEGSFITSFERIFI